jgi:NTP pyrophosphatase (non-canonical NTP hydrolase)
MSQRPEEMKLSREEGEQLIERLETDRVTAADRAVLVKLIRLYFWLSFALQETKISLKRLKVALFGEGRKGVKGRGSDDEEPPSRGSGGTGSESKGTKDAADGTDEAGAKGEKKRLGSGHGRQGSQAYTGAQVIVCRHEELSVGERCPACGRGRLYGLPSGVEIRIDGQALLSAVRYELEKLRCSACGEIFTAGLPGGTDEDKYSPRARAVLALGRYYLGLPFYRIEQFQAVVGVPVADATQWEQVERVADCAYPVFEQLKYLAAQSEVIHQDDTHVRILGLLEENRVAAAQGEPLERTGMYTTGLVAYDGERTICLYLSGRAHAGENLAAVLSLREADREPPIVMSDALAANLLADESAVIRSHCLAHGRRYFTEIEEVFPEECERVISDFKKVFEHEAATRKQAMTPGERLAYHQQRSAPILNALKAWLEEQFEQRQVEPASSLGKAFNYLLNHWPELTRFLTVAGAPLENNVVERALKLAIRQRKNSLFHASEHSAYVASVLTSVIATCVQAGVDALAYLVALQANRRSVFRDPAAWLPWNYSRQLEPG